MSWLKNWLKARVSKEVAKLQREISQYADMLEKYRQELVRFKAHGRDLSSEVDRLRVVLAEKNLAYNDLRVRFDAAKQTIDILQEQLDAVKVDLSGDAARNPIDNLKSDD